MKRIYYSIIRFFRNIWFYRKTFYNDRDYDYMYVYILEKRKLESMIKDLKRFNHETNCDVKYQKINIAISLLNIITSESMDENKYVNIRNLSRFFSSKMCNYLLDRIEQNEDRTVQYDEHVFDEVVSSEKVMYNSRIFALEEIYLEKAWRLYHKIMSYYSRNWWF